MNINITSSVKMGKDYDVYTQPSPWPSKRERVTGCRELAGCQFRKISKLGLAGRPSRIRNNQHGSVFS
jgi:hypothetical protein